MLLRPGGRLDALQEIQAVHRVRRLGQSKPCFAYRMVVDGTIERRVSVSMPRLLCYCCRGLIPCNACLYGSWQMLAAQFQDTSAARQEATLIHSSRRVYRALTMEDAMALISP